MKDNLSIHMIQPLKIVELFTTNCFRLKLCLNFSIFQILAFNKNIKVKGQEYSLKLVDTAGQDEYSIFPHEYAMDIHGYCLVYRYVFMARSSCRNKKKLINLFFLSLEKNSINNLKSFEVVKVIYDKLLELTGKIQLVCF